MAGIAVGVMDGCGTGTAGDGMHTEDGTDIAAPAIGAPITIGHTIIGLISIMDRDTIFRAIAGGAFMADRVSAAGDSEVPDRSAVAVFAAGASVAPGPVVSVAVEGDVFGEGGDAARALGGGQLVETVVVFISLIQLHHTQRHCCGGYPAQISKHARHLHARD